MTAAATHRAKGYPLLTLAVIRRADGRVFVRVVTGSNGRPVAGEVVPSGIDRGPDGRPRWQGPIPLDREWSMTDDEFAGLWDPIVDHVDLDIADQVERLLTPDPNTHED